MSYAAERTPSEKPEGFRTRCDKFTHVIVCDPEGVAVGGVPYMYARNISYVTKNMAIVPSQTHPTCGKFSVRGELLQVTSHNPQAIFSLVAKQDAVVPNIHEELYDLQKLDSFDVESTRAMVNRLVCFLKSIRLQDSYGDSLYWAPENYQEEGEECEQMNGEAYEDYTRRAICSHIKSAPLPMTRITPISDDRLDMMSEIMDLFHNTHDVIEEGISYTHFAPILRNSKNIRRSALRTLMSEEFRCIKNDEYVDGNSCFVFNESHMRKVKGTVPVDEAHERMGYYVGDYLRDLDMSHSFITGSAITACIIKTGVDEKIEHWDKRIDVLYPKVLTTFDPIVHESLKNENVALWNIRAVSQTEGLMVKRGESVSFTIKDGSDVDIAVDNTVSDEEYRQIAQGHYETIKRYYPYVKLREHTKPKGDWNYVVFTDDPLYIPVFRTVEIYRSSFSNICSHHVGAVRGCYTSLWSDTPQFYLTASAMWTSMHRSTPNYHYFAGRKSNPQDIIIKNMQRGIGVSDERLRELIDEYIDRKNIVLSHMPFYCGIGVPSSVFSASLEWKEYRDIVLAREARRRRKVSKAARLFSQ